MGANGKLAILILSTLLVLALLVISGERKEFKIGSGTRVDLKRIEKQVVEGRLSLHPAEFSKRLKSLEDSE